MAYPDAGQSRRPWGSRWAGSVVGRRSWAASVEPRIALHRLRLVGLAVALEPLELDSGLLCRICGRRGQMNNGLRSGLLGESGRDRAWGLGRDERRAFVGSRRAGVLFWRGVCLGDWRLGLEKLSFQIGPLPSHPLPPLTPGQQPPTAPPCGRSDRPAVRRSRKPQTLHGRFLELLRRLFFRFRCADT